MPITNFRGEWAFLSNFSPCEVMFEGLKFQSTEAAYQAAKTLSIQERKEFCYMGPVEAKKAGYKVTLRKDWDSIKLSVMEELLRQKFNYPHYKARLLSTGDEELIEGNHWGDTFYGVDHKKGGQNHLGKLLMKIRGELKLEAAGMKDIFQYFEKN